MNQTDVTGVKETKRMIRRLQKFNMMYGHITVDMGQNKEEDRDMNARLQVEGKEK